MNREDKAGLELTVIFHLVVLIVLLCLGIGYSVTGERSFVFDFSKQEQQQEAQRKEEMHDDISRRLDEKIAAAGIPSIKNIATNAPLKDDRNSNSDAEKLYEDAKRLASDLKNGYTPDIEEDARTETVDISQAKKDDAQKEKYSGPSVLSWTLDGRKASHLPIPAYRCYGAGVITVIIVVDPQGNVVNAKIDENSSDTDPCLCNFAIRAARLSKFSKSPSAPARQAGQIVYSFIAQ